MEFERLDKWISSQGTFSRRQVKELVRAGQIVVNGTVVRSTEQKISPEDHVLVKGQAISLQKYYYIMMNKPAGVLSATEDKKDKTVLDLVPKELMRPGLFPAGRLDKDTEGFVLLTNDGPFAHKILSPSRHVPKTYFCVLSAELDSELLRAKFAEGIDLGGGDITSPAEMVTLKEGPKPEVELTIYEGMYHQVKRMFRRFGLEVVYLKRIRIGNLGLDPNLAPGECRVILHNEALSIC